MARGSSQGGRRSRARTTSSGCRQLLWRLQRRRRQHLLRVSCSGFGRRAAAILAFVEGNRRMCSWMRQPSRRCFQEQHLHPRQGDRLPVRSPSRAAPSLKASCVRQTGDQSRIEAGMLVGRGLAHAVQSVSRGHLEISSRRREEQVLRRETRVSRCRRQRASNLTAAAAAGDVRTLPT